LQPYLLRMSKGNPARRKWTERAWQLQSWRFQPGRIPEGARWLAGGILAVVLAGIVAWALFVPAADWLARHDIGAATGPSLEKARTDARGGLLTLTAGLVAAAALVFTARNSVLSRRTFELTEQGQVTERYTKAVEQLGSDKIDVRIGGIYALERVARDSVRDHPTVVEVLTAFIREHSGEPWPKPASQREVLQLSTRPDVQAALAVVGRRDPHRDIRRVDLSGAILSGADLTGVNFSGANLTDANLSGTHLTRANLNRANLGGANLGGGDLQRANLTDANLIRANLTDANLNCANLTDANFTFADLTRVNLGGANLGGADLTHAILTRAYLTDANLTGAVLTGVNLTEANLTDADLTSAAVSGANLTDAFLTGANLSGADLTFADLTDANLNRADLTDTKLSEVKWPAAAPVPEGWRRDGSSGTLARS
jgi:uncharacterized protein YjbI with pentapeptide repeats